jgi:uncharacterized protein
MIFPTTLTAAGIAAIMNVWLAIRVGQVRTSEKVSIGDGGNEAVIRRMRAHANFVEFTPFVLALIAAIELASGGGAAPLWLWVVMGIYFVGRIAHGLGMEGGTFGKGRTVGTLTTMLTLFGLGLYAIALPHIAAGRAEAVTPVDLQSAETVPQN